MQKRAIFQRKKKLKDFLNYINPVGLNMKIYDQICHPEEWGPSRFARKQRHRLWLQDIQFLGKQLSFMMEVQRAVKLSKESHRREKYC